jgi:hypothetical protein
MARLLCLGHSVGRIMGQHSRPHSGLTFCPEHSSANGVPTNNLLFYGYRNTRTLWEPKTHNAGEKAKLSLNAGRATCRSGDRWRTQVFGRGCVLPPCIRTLSWGIVCSQKLWSGPCCARQPIAHMWRTTSSSVSTLARSTSCLAMLCDAIMPVQGNFHFVWAGSNAIYYGNIGTVP